MARGGLILPPGTLWPRLLERTTHAIQCGALQSIATESEIIKQDGIGFLVRIVSNLARKEQAKRDQDRQTTLSDGEFNPFLPYDEDLFVADISNTHLALLNKFNVVDHHLLIVTRAFEDQESLLTLDDFEALGICLAEFEGLVFYNAGKIAGASQRHKHLQMVPLPLAAVGPKVPIEPLLKSARFQGGVGTAPGLPFRHAVARIESAWIESPLQTAQAMLECYRTMLEAVGLQGEAGLTGIRQCGAYNLLVTREWMLLVPRSKESFESISVNAVGFAGAFLVRDERQMRLLKDCGPVTILKHVAVSVNAG